MGDSAAGVAGRVAGVRAGAGVGGGAGGCGRPRDLRTRLGWALVEVGLRLAATPKPAVCSGSLATGAQVS
ncbi:hypothetical protein [Streptomyces sp. B21-102]|uniref:hypothetical protein n=1 Tax=unclassified Streptomyces TaxID=2593676 RepID=UPI003FA79474